MSLVECDKMSFYLGLISPHLLTITSRLPADFDRCFLCVGSRQNNDVVYISRYTRYRKKFVRIVLDFINRRPISRVCHTRNYFCKLHHSRNDLLFMANGRESFASSS